MTIVEHTYITGAALGLNDQALPGLLFDLNAPYTGCLICGEVFQTTLDRRAFKDHNEVLLAQCAQRRHTWAKRHMKQHPESAHMALKLSGQFCTPEAALKLTPLGIFPVDSTDDEVKSAMAEAPRAPINDVQG